MLNLSNVVSQLQAQRKQVQSELGRLDAAINAVRGTDTGNGSGTIRVPSSRPRRRTLSAAGRLALHRKHAGRSELQKVRQVHRSLSAGCQQQVVGKLQPPKGHDGQRGRRSRGRRPRPLEAAILHNSPPRQSSRGGLGVGGERSLVSLEK